MPLALFNNKAQSQNSSVGYPSSTIMSKRPSLLNFDSISSICIPILSQGLEFDYCGIIIGQDLRYDGERVITDPSKEALSDKSSGIRSCKDPVLADRLIRNTYKTLMSRGQKGCFIYCEDKELTEYFKKQTK